MSVLNDVVFEHGKIPPQALDLEGVVLGSMMLEPAKLLEIIDMLCPEAFYKESHQLIYGAIKRLFARNESADILTVTEELRKSGDLEVAGGAYYILMLTNRISSTANIEHHARIVLQKFYARELIRIGSQMIKDSYEDTTDIFDLLDNTERAVLDLRVGTAKKSYRQINDPLMEYYRSISAGLKNKGKLSGVPTGFRELDRTTGGWQKTDLIIIASRPGMGKTSFALTVARNAAVEFKIPVGVFSLEMSEDQLIQRVVSGESHISSSKLRNFDLEDYEVTRISQKISDILDVTLYLDDTAALSIFDFQAKARRMVAHHGVQLIVIDYLQLMRGSEHNKANREREISEISAALKRTAKELKVPIIALSQLSRKSEERSDKRPLLSDLRESGSIEQDADLVLFLFRPAYYMKHDDPQYDELQSALEIIIAKNRNGPTRDDLLLKFIKEYTLVKEVDYEEEQQSSEIPPNPAF